MTYEQLKADCEDLFNQKEMMFKNMQLNQLKVCELAKVLDEIREIINQNMTSYSSCIKAFDEIEEILDKVKDL